MEVYIKTPTWHTVKLDDNPLGSKGGQGAVYRILAPVSLSDCCVKVYHNPCERATVSRLEYMINHPPAMLDSAGFRICWPKALTYDIRGRVVGFVMSLAFPKSRNIYILTYYSKGKTIAHRFKSDTDWFGKYERTSGDGILNRLKMMANISQAFYQIHKSGNYVVSDVKPENILASSSGLISIVDTDSFQIAENDRLLFEAPVATPEYCAPELYVQILNNKPLSQSNDLFSLAVLYYQILIGVHPFSGVRMLPPFDTDDYSELKEKIKRSLFIYGSNRRYIQPLDPNPHAFFERIPKALQRMFIRAFDAPNYRPSMEEWCKLLYKLINL